LFRAGMCPKGQLIPSVAAPIVSVTSGCIVSRIVTIEPGGSGSRAKNLARQVGSHHSLTWRLEALRKCTIRSAQQRASRRFSARLDAPGNIEMIVAGVPTKLGH